MSYRRNDEPLHIGEFYPECKVYSDGSHYIAIPHTERKTVRRPKPPEQVITVPDEPQILFETENEDAVTGENAPIGVAESQVEQFAEQSEDKAQRGNTRPVTERKITKKELFEELYTESLKVKKIKRRKLIIQAMRPYFESERETEYYVDANIERKKRNLISRRVRMARKANLADFNYFCTFTYSSELHTEESFKKKLKNKLSLLAYRQGWKYMGVWERSPEKQRLHFHGLFYVPEGKMIGKIERHGDYSVRLKRVQTTYQNSYFNEKFGRSDFESIDDKSKLGEAMAYLMKYIEKSGERIVYSKGLPQFFISDIMDDDVISKIGIEDKKLLLYDDFHCWDEGAFIGKASQGAIRSLRKSN